ncbi:MAG: YcxB family protein [Planctomycetaceae bacterium]
MIVHFEFGEEDLLAANRYHISNSPSLRRQRVTVGISMAFIGFLSGTLLIPTLGTAAIFVGILLAISLNIFIAYQMRRNIDVQTSRLLKEGRNDGLFGPQEIEVTDLGVERRNPFRRSFVAWSIVRRMEETPDLILLYVSSIEAIAIPRKRITEGNLDELITEINRHLPGPWAD